MKKLFATLLTPLIFIFSIGFILPEDNQMPVQRATKSDWNPKSFWYFPWGKSRVHKGIDVFANEGTTVIAPTGGYILFNGKVTMGGNVVLMLGAKWRLHYFAHLKNSNDLDKKWGFIDSGQAIGYVGTTGNAKGKSPHLHYSIRTLYPQFWKYNPKTKMAWQRLFYIKPDDFLSI